ncbi:NYN domain-containing protein [Gilvimarinus algae]|uniref:NYN domain-containing protein n=1 Tax=Gilvimarinus algae TaxID=3058037 RepID=A0ABT8TC96_9GAMM|nr:NYN domain-containing protein [Gilvimarinus sp. SDUM040014]MDO3381546.1 NYN domain-containing protein [Gilvimarinus sp. SDUM040014]
MKDLDTEKKIAVLIDAENAQCSVLGAALAELSKHGHIIVKKAYGDWSSTHLKNWKLPLNELAINPVQQFSYTQGKNSSDAAMIIDAMDLLYSNKFDAFALISSDSDFTKLASRLKESQIYVFGVGEQKTPVAFRNACDDFIYTEVLRDLETDQVPEDTNKPSDDKQQKKSRQQLSGDARLISILRNSISEYADDDGWAPLGNCGGLIKRQYPDFDSRTYGYASLSKLIEATELFDLSRRKPASGQTPVLYVKDRRA